MNTLYWIIFIIILGPIIGSIIGITIKPSKIFLCISLGFTAGVMFGVAFFQLIPESIEISSIIVVVIAFISGFTIMAIVDQILPHFHPIPDTDEKKKFKRTAMTLVVGIALHNFPEGFAVGASFSSMTNLGLIVAIAIALHDVPETIIPVASNYSLYKNTRKALWIGLLTTIPTLIGLFLGKILLESVTNDMMAFVMVMTAGIMVYISGDELLPASQKYGYDHISNFSLASGIIFDLFLGVFV